MRAPVEFLVTRQLLSDTDFSPAEIARRCHLRESSVARAFKKIQSLTDLEDQRLFRHLLGITQRPHWSTLYFAIPNPKQWNKVYEGPRWFSGEIAAEMEGYNLIAERWLIYLLPDDMKQAVQAAKREFAKMATPANGNLVLRTTDPWMDLTQESPLVQRGQRLLDYWTSRHIQLTAELMHD